MTCNLFPKRSCKKVHYTFYTFHSMQSQTRLNSILSKRHERDDRRFLLRHLPPSTHPSKSYDIALHDGKHTLVRPTKYEVDAFRNLGGRSRGGENRRRRKRRSGWERAWTRNESAGRNHERQGSGGEVGGTGRGEQGSHRGETTRRKELNKNGKEQGVTRCSIGIADPA